MTILCEKIKARNIDKILYNPYIRIRKMLMVINFINNK